MDQTTTLQMYDLVRVKSRKNYKFVGCYENGEITKPIIDELGIFIKARNGHEADYRVNILVFNFGMVWLSKFYHEVIKL